MFRNTEAMVGSNSDTNSTGMKNTVIGIMAYLLIVVPVVTFVTVASMNLGETHGVAVAGMLVMAGLYVTERFACRNT